MSSTESADEDTAVTFTTPPKKREKASPLSKGEKNMILNVYKKEMLNNNNNITTIVKNTVTATGVCRASVYRIIKEYRANHKLSSPKKVKRRLSILDATDEFDRTAIRRKVHSFFMNNELPTVDKVLSAVNEDINLPNFKRTTFFKLLKTLNFKYECRSRCSLLIERDDIILWRRQYLQQIKSYREEGRRIYYTDETWVDAGHTRDKVWKDPTVQSAKEAFLSGLSTGSKNPSGKGKRLIVAHIGSESGFVDNCAWIFESDKSGDYHSEMNSKSYEEWFSKILSNCEEGSVIVVDNAPYHSRRLEATPTSSWSKQKIKDWLLSKNINMNEDLLKVQLLELARKHKSQFQAYVIDEMAKEQNKIVLRTPPYHCELNPIELIWAQVKGFIAKNNTTFKISEVRKLLNEAIVRVGADEWAKCVAHVKNKVEKDMWAIDNCIDEVVERFIINVDDSSELESESVSTSD